MAGVPPPPQLNEISNEHAVMPTKRPAADVRPLEPKGKIRNGPSKGTELNSMPPPMPVPSVVSMVDSISPFSREVSEASAPASSSHRQGAEARKVKRIRSVKRKIRGCEAGYERVEAEAHLGSPSFHQSGMSSDDLFGEDEVESVRPSHIEGLGAAYRSLESEGGVIGAAALGTKRGRMPSAKIAIAQLYGWSSSGGFAEARCLEAEPGRGQLKITEDFVGGPHGGIVHFCATDAKVCKPGWPGRRVYHFDIWRPSPSPVVGAQRRKELRITKSSLSLRRQTSSMKTSIHSAQGRKPFLESPRSFSRSLRMSRAGLVAWVRSRASWVVVVSSCKTMNPSLDVSIVASQVCCREFKARLMAVQSQLAE